MKQIITYFSKARRLGIVSWILVILVWQLFAFHAKPDFLPGPLATALGIRELLADGTLVKFILVSLRRVLIGWFLGSLLGVPAGILIGRFRFIREIVEPLIDFIRFIPAIAFITLFLLWFGIGEPSKIILIIYATSFIVIINTVTGVMAIQEEKIRAARSLGASEWQILFHVIVPATIPYIFTGVRLAMGNSFMAIVGAEMIAAKEGIGYLIWTARLYFKTDWVFAGLISLGLMGYLTDRLLRFIGSTSLRRYGISFGTNFGGR